MACPLDIFLTEIKIVSYCVLSWPNPLEVNCKYLYSYNKHSAGIILASLMVYAASVWC